MSPIAWQKRADMRYIDHDVPRVDGPQKVTGRARYTHDVRLPDMLWARVLLAPRPVVHPILDLEPAREVPGVEAVMSLEELFPLREGWTRRLGQPLAVVAATTPEAAEDGLRAIYLEVEEGPWVADYDQATAEGAPAVSGDGNVRFRRERGDEAKVAAALDECDELIEAEYATPIHLHTCLETHGVVVDYRGGDEATIYASTQGTFTVAGEAAGILGLDVSSVRVIVQHMGGGFGAKFGLDVPGLIACYVARETWKPVHLMFTRHDQSVCAGNRSGSRQKVVAGVKDGKLHALSAEVSRLGGVGQGAHPGLPYIYDVPHARLVTQSVLTNTDGSRAMRAPGHPQASFAMESVVDELCAAIGDDPLEFRKRNLSDPVYHRQLDRCAREIGWDAHPNKQGPPKELAELAVGIGFGVSTWGSGGRKQCQVKVRIARDGSVLSAVGTQDIGTGTRTYVATIVADELGVPLDSVRAEIGDSRLGASVASGGSVTVPSLAPAIKDAAVKAKAALFEHLGQTLDVFPDQLVLKDGAVWRDDERLVTWQEACSSLPVAGLEADGEFRDELAGRGVHGAQAAKVEVDTLTGALRVVKMVGVQNVGIPLNRLACRSQINGGMIQAMSYGLWEEFVLDPWIGVPLNAGLEEYKMAGTMDVPEMVAILDDEDTRPQVMGIGEPTVIPGHSAIACALYNATGVRLRELPLTRDKILMALAERS